MPIKKLEVLGKIVASGLVCVIRADSPDQAAGIARPALLGALLPWKSPSPCGSDRGDRASGEKILRPNFGGRGHGDLDPETATHRHSRGRRNM